jgi:hypothetical protein
VLPPDRYFLSENIPDYPSETVAEEMYHALNDFRSIIVLIASPIECHLFAGYFANPAIDISMTICKQDILHSQNVLYETYDCSSVNDWAEKNIRIPFGIDIYRTPFPSDGILHLTREGTDLYFLRIGPELVNIPRMIDELSEFSTEEGMKADASLQTGNSIAKTQIGDLISFPFSFLNKSIDPSCFPKVDGCDHEGLFLLKFCDYDVEFPVNALTNNIQSIKRAFPNYVRKQLFFGKVWFVDVPRTSSSSIKVELQKHFGLIFGKKNLTDKSLISTQIIPNHIPAKVMRMAVGEEIWDKIFTFSFVRNPWDRMVSLFHYRKIVAKNIPENMTFSEYIYLLRRDRGTGLFQYHGYYYGNADYLLGDHDEILVKFIGRYENRERDILHVAKSTGIHDIGTVITQKSRETVEPYSRYYTAESREIVADLFRKDLDVFGYTFDYHG